MQCSKRHSLFDHLIGEQLHRDRDVDAKSLGGLDYKLELGGLHDWQVGGLLAPENPRDVEAHEAVDLSQAVAAIKPPA
jgi:hypothetical protein